MSRKHNDCPCGWLDDDGILHPCAYYGHASVAHSIIEQRGQLGRTYSYGGNETAEGILEKEGWLRITYDVPDTQSVAYHLKSTDPRNWRFVPLRGHWGSVRGVPSPTNSQIKWLEENDEWLSEYGRKIIRSERFWDED